MKIDRCKELIEHYKDLAKEIQSNIDDPDFENDRRWDEYRRLYYTEQEIKKLEKKLEELMTQDFEELDFEEVKPGMILYDHSRNDEKIGIVLATGKLTDLADYDDEGIIEDLTSEDDDYEDANAVAFYARVGKYETAVTPYGEWGWAFCKKEDN